MQLSPIPVEHIQQQAIGFCLPACAQMALTQFDIHVRQDQLAQTLGTIAGLGTPFPSIIRLELWNVHVKLVSWRGIDVLMDALNSRQAVIAAILTSGDMPGWSDIRTQHTVLITAMDDRGVAYNDPALASGPVHVSRDAFWLAWSEMSEQAALISRIQM